MRILLDCRPLLMDRSSGEKKHFIISCINILAGRRGVEWLLLVDRSYREGLLPDIGGHDLLTRKEFPGKAGLKLWYDWQIPATVKKYKPDLVMTTGGLSSPRIDRPQCIWMPERADPADWMEKKSYARIYQKRLLQSLREAETIFSFSEKDKTFLVRQLAGSRAEVGKGMDGRTTDYGAPDKIVVVQGAADERYEPLSGEEKEKIKLAYADGKEYFLAIVSGARPAELIDLLKAFSRFKKRQQSNMQLVLTGVRPDPGIADIITFPDAKLDSYKYRSAIHVYNRLPEQDWSGLVAASYAFVDLFSRESLGLPVLNAWKAGVPVVTTVTGCLPEIGGEAVLYARPGDQASLASQLMLLYKDESQRTSLIEKGKMRLQLLSWERSAGQVWEGIERALRV